MSNSGIGYRLSDKGATLVATILSFVICGWTIAQYHTTPLWSDLADFGQFISAPSSALALIWLVYNQHLVRRQLELQRNQNDMMVEQTRLAREEMNRSIEAVSIDRTIDLLEFYERLLLRHGRALAEAVLDPSNPHESAYLSGPDIALLSHTCEKLPDKTGWSELTAQGTELEIFAMEATYLEAFESVENLFSKTEHTRAIFRIWSENSDFRRLAITIRGRHSSDA